MEQCLWLQIGKPVSFYRTMDFPVQGWLVPKFNLGTRTKNGPFGASQDRWVDLWRFLYRDLCGALGRIPDFIGDRTVSTHFPEKSGLASNKSDIKSTKCARPLNVFDY